VVPCLFMNKHQAVESSPKSGAIPDAVDASPPIRIGPGGRIETEDEYQARMAHNTYMRFSRSLKRADCPKPVLDAAAGKKHNRAMMGQLYEEYLTSGENWMSSSLVVNASRKLSSKRRGKYRMCMYKDLKVQFGPGIAKQLRDSKKELESTKRDTDTCTYWCEHPDFKGMPGKEDYELVRIWDSLTFEDDVEDELALSLCASGSLSENQTRQALQVATSGEIARLQSSALGLHEESRPSSITEPEPKVKKPPNTQRLVASKISALSAKNAEIMSWDSKVNESDKLFLDVNILMKFNFNERHCALKMNSLLGCR
ncbi:unnamed protein product, partial [Durusdinium trenchii]